ncbi:MAG: hypothetical protein ACRDTD_26695, partial [Pseudonocardiaceae bacterium]
VDIARGPARSLSDPHPGNREQSDQGLVGGTWRSVLVAKDVMTTLPARAAPRRRVRPSRPSTSVTSPLLNARCGALTRTNTARADPPPGTATPRP